MFDIVHKEVIAPDVTLFRIRAPQIAQKRQAGQFVIIQVDEQGERIPLTIADADPDAGTITLISQSVGKTTHLLADQPVGGHLTAVVGPLGRPTHIEKYGTVVCVGGGIGIAPLYPIAQAMKQASNKVVGILGARSQDLLILEEEMRRVCDEVRICTDDGSYGKKGFVTHVLQDLYDEDVPMDLVVAIGPPVMMKNVGLLTKPHQTPTLVSLNSIMVDGTGMCGGCRVTVAGRAKFVCVDGPEFDGHDVDFDGLERRLQMYREHECLALKRYQEQKSRVVEQSA